jgi:hypothetical protein
MTLRRCYKPTVNEPETITDAKPLCSVRNRSESSGFWVSGLVPVTPPIERS